MDTRSEPSDLLSAREAARAVGVSPPTISGWMRSGFLPWARVGRRRMVRYADLLEAQRIAHASGVVPAWRADPQRAGQRLRAMREAAGLSQLALAPAAGLSHEAISLLEHGHRAPQAATVHKLALALGVSPAQFVAQAPIGLSKLTTAEAAARLGVPVGRVQVWLKRGELPGSVVSGQWRIPEIAVAELDRSGRLRGRSRRLDPRYRV